MKSTVVIFFNDWPVYPQGVNAGGGESATMALARAMRKQGYRVIACANLPEGEGTFHDIEFWDFGSGYDLSKIEIRLRELPSYHCLCATLVHPLLLIKNHKQCLSRIVINHAPSIRASGLEPVTMMNIIDRMVCVSHAQRALLMHPTIDSSKIIVVKNGFDPDIFQYAGPENRDWNQLVYIGRVEPSKGIHILLQAYAWLQREFPDLKLSVFGDEQYWPDLLKQKQTLLKNLPGLTFHGKRPQRELATHLQRAGLLVFPSISFESAGLAVVDAQASGCPAIGFGIGGVPEYLVDGVLGKVVYDRSADALLNGIQNLLRDRTTLQNMSQRAEVVGRARPWTVVAREIADLFEEVASKRVSHSKGQSEDMPFAIKRIQKFSQNSVVDVLEAHEMISSRELVPDSLVESFLAREPQEAWVPLIQGIREEKSGALKEATDYYTRAARLCESTDWQPFFRLAVLHAEQGQAPVAAQYAKQVLTKQPDFQFRSELEKLIELAG